MISKAFECRKFSANMFNLSKCQHCFRSKEVHTAEALDCNRVTRKISKCGYLFVAPDWDFSVAVNRTKRWQRRWFVLYEDGELTFSVDEHPDTIPQAVVDMTKVIEVSDAEEVTGSKFAIAIKTPDKVHFVKGTCKEESKWWFDVLVGFPRNNKKSKRNATFTSIKTTVSPTQVSCTHQSWCVAYPQVESSRCCQQLADSSRLSSINDNDLVVPTRNIEIIIADSHTRHSYVDSHCPNRSKSRRENQLQVSTNSEELSPNHITTPSYSRLSDIPIMKRYESLENLDIDHNRSVCSPRTSFCQTDGRVADPKGFSHLYQKSFSTTEVPESWKETTVRGDPDGCGLDHIAFSPSSVGEMLRVDALEHLPKNMYHVKKGWLLRQDYMKSGEWHKKWCVLYSTHMKIFQDQSSEERGSLDYVVYMNLVHHIEEADVNRNYGFKLKMTDGSCQVFSAVTSGIRNGWISALKNAANLCVLSDELTVHFTRPSNIELNQNTPVLSNLEDQTSLKCSVTHTTHSIDGGIVSITTSIPTSTNNNNGGNCSGNSNNSSRIPPLSPPLNRTAISKVKERAKSSRKSTSQKNLEKSSEEYKTEGANATIVDKGSQKKEKDRRCTLPVNLDTTLKVSDSSCDSSHSYLPKREEPSSRERSKSFSPQNHNNNKSELDNGINSRHLVSLKVTLDSSNIESDSNVQVEGEKRIHLGSLSDLTNIGKEVNPETVPRDALAHKYQELRNRFEKAVDEIRALQKELKEAHFKCDHLEVTCMNKKREVDAIENDYQSQLNLMSVRIEDLTNKLSLSEKQLRLQPKLGKSNSGSCGKEQRRTRSLKGKESLTVSKEVENKVDELEKKLKTVEGVLNFRSQDNLCLGLKHENIFGEFDKSPDKSHLFVRLNSLESKVEEAASKVFFSQQTSEFTDDRSSIVESEYDPSMRLTVSELMSKIDHLCKRVMQLEEALGKCRLKVELAKTLIGTDTGLENMDEHFNEVIKCLDSCLITKHQLTCELIHDRSECIHEIILRRIQWIRAAFDAILCALDSDVSPQWPQWLGKSIDNEEINNLSCVIDQLEPLKVSMASKLQPWLNTMKKSLALRVSCEMTSETSFDNSATIIRLRDSFLVVLADLVGRVTDSDLGDVWSHLLIGSEKESLWPRIVEETVASIKNIIFNNETKQVSIEHVKISEEVFSFVTGGYAFLTLAIDSLLTHLKAMNNTLLNNHCECEKLKNSNSWVEPSATSSTPRIVGEVMKKNEKESECSNCLDFQQRFKLASDKYSNDLLNEKEILRLKLEKVYEERDQLIANLKIEKLNECDCYKSEVNQLQDRLKNLEEDYEVQLLSLKQMFEGELAKRVDIQDNMIGVQKKYKSEIEQLKNLCEKGLAAMEHSHKRIVAELDEKWKRKSEKLQVEKEQALAEETKATLAALDAMRKAHEAELQKEVARFKEEFLEKMGNSSADLDALHREHEEEMETIKREILSLSEKYSIKCLECVALDEHLELKHQELAEANALIIDLTARNRQLRSHLKQNVKELSSLHVDSSDLLTSLRLREGQLLEKQEEISDLCRKLSNLQTSN